MLRRYFVGGCSAACAAAVAAALGCESAAAQSAPPAPDNQAQGAPSAAAAPQKAVSGGTVNLDAITVTATKTEESVVDAMAGVSVVKRGQINQQMPASVSEMLQDVPGVASEVTPNDPGQSISIRGLQDFGRVNVLVDGARQDYEISGHNGSGSFYLDPEFIGQADVVRGPVSNIYGSGAIGGVVSFRTRDIDDILHPDERYGAEERVILNSNGLGIVNSSSAGARIGTQADVFGQLVYRNFSSYKDGGGQTVADTGQQLLGGLFKLNLRPSDGQQISLSALTQNFDFTNNGASTDGARFHNDVTAGTYTLGYTLKPAETPLVDFSSKIYYSTTTNKQTYLAPDSEGVYPALGVVAGDADQDTIDTYGFDVHNTSRFATGVVRHALTVGVDGVLDQVHTTDDAGGYISALTPSGQRTLAGGFVQDELTYGDWLRVLGALRYDSYSLNGDGVSSSGTHLSPKLTVGVTPIRGFEIYGTYAEGYRAPSVTETLIAGVHPYPAFTFLPNPDLKPEVAHNFEAGVNLKYDNVWRQGDTVRGKFTAFTNRVNNFIDLGTTSSSTLVNFIPGLPNSYCAFLPPGTCAYLSDYQYQNVSQAQLDGVEMEGAYDWGRGVVSFAGSAVNGKDLTTGYSLYSVAPYRFSTTVAFRFLNNNALTVGARFTGVSHSPDNIPPGSTLPPTAGYGLVDLFAAYKYSDYVSGDLSVTNLFDKNYTQYLSSEPNPGLTVRAGLTIRFAAK